MALQQTSSSRLATAVAALAAASVVTACGSSGNGSGGDGDEIVLGSLGPYTGTFSSTYGAVPDVLQAWATTVNDAGGIDGRPVRVVSVDIGTSPGAGASAVRELIERDNAMAIVANQDAGVSEWAPYADSQGVPILSATTETDSWTNPNNFNAQGSAFAVVYGLGQQAKEAGGTLGTAYCAERPTCAQQSQLLQLFVQAQNVSVPVAAEVPASTADFTAYCQQLVDADVDVVFNSLSSELAVRMNTSCAQQGLEAQQLISGSLTNLSWKTEPVYRDSLVFDVVAPFFDTTVPGVAEYREALDEHAADMVGTEQDNSEALRAWASLQVFAAAAEQVDGELTSASLVDGMHALTGETLDGIVPPIAFTAGGPALTHCYFRWTPFGEFRALDDGEPTCIDDALIEPLVEPVLESLGR